MSFAAQVQCADGTYYDIEGEGGNIHAYRMAYSLFLFMRDIAAGDFVGWINQQLATVPSPDHSTLDRQQALIAPLRNVYGVSDKVLTMALSGILIADSKHYPGYAERQNLTMRMQMRRFTRLTNAFSKKFENHMHMVALYTV